MLRFLAATHLRPLAGNVRALSLKLGKMERAPNPLAHLECRLCGESAGQWVQSKHSVLVHIEYCKPDRELLIGANLQAGHFLRYQRTRICKRFERSSLTSRSSAGSTRSCRPAPQVPPRWLFARTAAVTQVEGRRSPNGSSMELPNHYLCR